MDSNINRHIRRKSSRGWQLNMTGLSPPPISQTTITDKIDTVDGKADTISTAVVTTIPATLTTIDGKADTIVGSFATLPQYVALPMKLGADTYDEKSITQQNTYVELADLAGYIEIMQVSVYRGNNENTSKEVTIKITIDGRVFTYTVSLVDTDNQGALLPLILIRTLDGLVLISRGAADSSDIFYGDYFPLRCGSFKVELKVNDALATSEWAAVAIDYSKGYNGE